MMQFKYYAVVPLVSGGERRSPMLDSQAEAENWAADQIREHADRVTGYFEVWSCWAGTREGTLRESEHSLEMFSYVVPKRLRKMLLWAWDDATGDLREDWFDSICDREGAILGARQRAELIESLNDEVADLRAA